MGYREELEAGRDAFGHLIRAWHERNGWSQRILPALAEQLELGRVHNSQLSNLRNRKLTSPGPELFVALGRLNQLMARDCGPAGVAGPLREQLRDQPELLAALQASALPLLTENGDPLGPAQLFEIFVGLRPLPSAFDLRITEQEAPGLSAALAELFCQGRPWRTCRDRVVAAYPVAKRVRRERFIAVMAGLADYSGSDLEMELPDLLLAARSLQLQGSDQLDAAGLLDRLRQTRTSYGRDLKTP